MDHIKTAESQASNVIYHSSLISRDSASSDSCFHQKTLEHNEKLQQEPNTSHRLNAIDSGDARTAFQRIGRSALAVLIITLLVIISVVGFLGFIFWGDTSSQNWHTIMVRGWATRAVSVPSLALRTAIDMQAGIVAAMLAALALESGSILIHDAAKLSTARASNARPRSLVVPLCLGSRTSTRLSKNTLSLAAVALLIFTTVIVQFSSTILLSDLRLGTLPGLLDNSSNTIDFEYFTFGIRKPSPGGWTRYQFVGYKSNLLPRIPTWMRRPINFPRFAEYSEPAESHDGVDDTGVLVRSFLPYSNQELREMVRNYSGAALLLDARVSCQRPALSDLLFDTPFGPNPPPNGTDDSILQISHLIGSLAPSVNAPRLTTPGTIPFNCSFLIANETRSLCALQGPPWLNNTSWMPVSNRAGGLISEFSNETDPMILQPRYAYSGMNATITWGIPFIIFETTSRHFGTATPYEGYKGPLFVPFSNYTRTNNYTLRVEADGIWSKIYTQHGPANLSLSLCYTAFDTQRIDVDLFGDKNSSEPDLRWINNHELQMDPLNRQLGNVRENLTDSSRGIMSIRKKSSWLPHPQAVRPYGLPPFVQQYSAMDPTISPYGMLGVPGNLTAIWSFSSSPYMRQPIERLMVMKQAKESLVLSPDNTLGYLFDSAFKTSGSLARAVSSLITVLSSMAYYDQMFQFDLESQATQSFFVTSLFPQSHHGFWLVVSVVTLHLILVVIITAMFALYSRYTFLGNHWQGVAQLHSRETDELIRNGTTATEAELRMRLRAANMHKMPVVIAPTGCDDKVALTRNDV